MLSCQNNSFKLIVPSCFLTVSIADFPFEDVIIHRGQLATSQSSIGSTLNLTKMQVRTALQHLKLTQEITVTKKAKFSLISINNYDYYQSVTQQTTSKQHSNNTRLTLAQQQLKNNKELKRIEEEFSLSSIQSLIAH